MVYVPPTQSVITPVSPVTTPATPVKKEYDFFEPFVFSPTWKLEAAEVGSNYALLQTTKGKEADVSLETLVKDNSKPLLFLGKPIYEIMMEIGKYASDEYNSEAAGYMLCTQLNSYSPHWEVWGLFMTGQTASGAEVELEGSDFPRYLAYLKEHYPELMLRTVVIHFHFHGSMGVFWSSVDVKQQYDRSQLAQLTGYRFFLVGNDKKQLKGKFIQYSPVQFEVDDINIGISFNNPAYLDFNIRDHKEQIHKMVDSLLEVQKVYGLGGMGGYNNWRNPNPHYHSKWYDQLYGNNKAYGLSTKGTSTKEEDDALAGLPEYLTGEDEWGNWDPSVKTGREAEVDAIITDLHTIPKKETVADYMAKKRPEEFKDNLVVTVKSYLNSLEKAVEAEFKVPPDKIYETEKGLNAKNILHDHFSTYLGDRAIGVRTALQRLKVLLINAAFAHIESGEFTYLEDIFGIQAEDYINKEDELEKEILCSAADGILQFTAMSMLVDTFDSNVTAEDFMVTEIIDEAVAARAITVDFESIICSEMGAFFKSVKEKKLSIEVSPLVYSPVEELLALVAAD